MSQFIPPKPPRESVARPAVNTDQQSVSPPPKPVRISVTPKSNSTNNESNSAEVKEPASSSPLKPSHINTNQFKLGLKKVESTTSPTSPTPTTTTTEAITPTAKSAATTGATTTTTTSSTAVTSTILEGLLSKRNREGHFDKCIFILTETTISYYKLSNTSTIGEVLGTSSSLSSSAAAESEKKKIPIENVLVL
jgi:hypothetical protein